MKKNEPPADDSNFVSMVGKRRLKSLFVPTRKKQAVQKMDIKVPVTIESSNKKTFECPLCSELINAPYPVKIKNLIKKITKNNEMYEKEKREEYEKEMAEQRANGLPVMPFVFEPAGMSSDDKVFFCRTHRVELEFRPLGIKNNYPQSIDFKAIESRILVFKDDLKSIVDKKLQSSYLDDALKRFDNLGAKSRKASEVIKVFHEFLPGYYGNKGLHYIMEALNTLFLQTKELNEDNANPLTPMDYIQQVLVPECGIRLIQQDRDNAISLEEAKRIMKESQEYGSFVYFKAEKARIVNEKDPN